MNTFRIKQIELYEKMFRSQIPLRPHLRLKTWRKIEISMNLNRSFVMLFASLYYKVAFYAENAGCTKNNCPPRTITIGITNKIIVFFFFLLARIEKKTNTGRLGYKNDYSTVPTRENSLRKQRRGVYGDRTECPGRKSLCREIKYIKKNHRRYISNGTRRSPRIKNQNGT